MTLFAQSIEMRANDGIAFARRRFESLTVPDRDAPMRVADQPGLLEGAGHAADGRPLHPEHHRQKLMAQMEITFVHPVMGRQQPPSTPLLDVMTRIARR